MDTIKYSTSRRQKKERKREKKKKIEESEFLHDTKASLIIKLVCLFCGGGKTRQERKGKERSENRGKEDK